MRRRKAHLTRTASFPAASQQLWMDVASCQISPVRMVKKCCLPACLPPQLCSVETDSKFISTSVRFKKKKKKKKELCRVEHLIKVSASDRRLRECECRRCLPASQAALAGCKVGGGRGLNTEPLFSPAKCRSLHIPANATRKTAGGPSPRHCVWSDKAPLVGNARRRGHNRCVPNGGRRRIPVQHAYCRDVVRRCRFTTTGNADLLNAANTGCCSLQVKSVRNPTR